MTTPPHLGGHLNITNTDEPLLKWFVDRLDILSMLDLGCGPGGMLDIADRMGLPAIGVDGDPFIHHPKIFHHDFTSGPFVNSIIPWPDFIWCVEFVEHVEEKFSGNFLCLFPCSKFVFLTHAVPGQGGHHHVNEQQAEYWIKRMNMVGFVHDEDLSGQSREQATNKYTKATGMIFVNRRQINQEWGP